MTRWAIWARVVMADGGVLVSDLGGDHIARFDSDGMLIGTWPIPEGPIAVAVHPTNGNYYVSLRDEGTVGIYAYDGNTDSLVRSSPGSLSEGNPMVNFVRPTDMDIASNSGRIYVVDAGGDRVYGFEANGDLALMFGERGELMGQFLYPSAIAVDEANGRLIVADQDNFRIQVFTTSGIFERRFGYRMKYVGAGQEGWMPRTQGLAVDAAGHIYVADALMSTVRVFDAAGSELGQVVGYGFGPGDLRAAFGLDLNGDDSRLYVVSSGTCSVEIYQTPGFGTPSPAGTGDSESGTGAVGEPGTNWCKYDALRTGAAGSEDDYQRPDFTPEIASVEGQIGSNQLVVVFTMGAWADSDLTGALTPDDFWLFDKDGNNPRGIVYVIHTPGEATAPLTMSAPLQLADLSIDAIATTGKSVWAWYEGGYENYATGTIPAQAVSAGPWPVVMNTGPDAGFVITKVEGVWNHDRIHVEFSEAAYANIDGTGNLEPADFLYTNVQGGASSIVDVAHTAGGSTAIITLNQNLVSGANGDLGYDTLSAASHSIHTAAGSYMLEAPVVVAVADEPWLVAVQGVVDHSQLSIWISEGAYANRDATGVLEPTDFAFIDAGTGKSIIAVHHTSGRPNVTVVLDGPVVVADIGGATLAPVGDSIFDVMGYAAPSIPTTMTDGVTSSIASVAGVEGSNKLEVTFLTQVYANADETGALEPGDFVFSDGNGGGATGILSIAHAAGSDTAIVTVNTSLLVGDIDSDTLSPAVYSIFGPKSGSFPLPEGAVTISGQAAPVLTRVEGAVGFDQLFVSFADAVYTEADGTGAMMTTPSTGYSREGGPSSFRS